MCCQKKIEQKSNVSKLRESLKTIGFQWVLPLKITPLKFEMEPENWPCLNFWGPVSASRRVDFGRIPPSKKTTTFCWVAIYTPHGHFRLIFVGFSSIFVVASFSWSSTVTFGYLTRKLAPYILPQKNKTHPARWAAPRYRVITPLIGAP